MSILLAQVQDWAAGMVVRQQHQLVCAGNVGEIDKLAEHTSQGLLWGLVKVILLHSDWAAVLALLIFPAQ